MKNNSSPEDGRLSKFSNADRASYAKPSPEGGRGSSLDSAFTEAADPPLSDLIEHLIRDGGLGDLQSQGETKAAQNSRVLSLLPDREPDTGPTQKLLEELNAAQQQVWTEPEEFFTSAKEEIPPPGPELERPAPRAPRTAGRLRAAVFSRLSALPLKNPFATARAARAKQALQAMAPHSVLQRARFAPGAGKRWARSFWKGAVRLSGRLRLRDWLRRYLTLITFLHRRIFDRAVEQLLFIKTPPPAQPEALLEGEGLSRPFVYAGPVPRKALNWALSALPADLKRYVFVDFRASGGRTLLLAARRNFEYAIGYAFDASSCEELEMNLAQYPRSYMSCRDVRAVRGDLEGVTIPPQQAVLFFPDTMRESHLDIVMSYVSASYRLNPRTLYLIFENVGPQHSLRQTDIFERVHLPILSRIKAGLFSPAKLAVYRSIETDGETGF